MNESNNKPQRRPIRLCDLPEKKRREILEDLRPAREEADRESAGLFWRLQSLDEENPTDLCTWDPNWDFDSDDR